MKKSCMKSLQKILAMLLVSIMVASCAPNIVAKAAQKTWKVVTNAHTVVDWIYNISGDGIFVGGKDDKSFLLNANLEIISKKYDSIYDAGDGYYCIYDNEKHGAIDSSGKEIIPLKYSDVSYCGDGYFLVARVSKDKYGADVWKYGILNKNGKQVLPMEYDFIYYADDDYFVSVNFEEDGDWFYGVINKSGKTIIPHNYTYLYYLGNGYFIVTYNYNQYGVIDGKGNIIIPVDEHYIAYWGKDTFIIDNNELQTSIYDAKADTMVELPYRVLSYSDKYMTIYDGHMTGILDKKGNEVLPLEYYDIAHVGDQYFIVANENFMYGVMDINGTMILPTEYHYIDYYNDSCFATYQYDEFYNSTCKIFDLSGKEVLKNVYDYAYYYDGFLLVSKNNKYGYFDKNFKEVIALTDQEMYRFNIDNEDFFYISDGKSTKILNSKKKVVFEGKDKEIQIIHENDYGYYRPISKNTKLVFYAADVKSETVKTNKKCTLYKEDNIAKGSIANLKSGAKVIFIEDQGNGWSLVSYNSSLGYVKNNCLNKKGLSTYKTTVTTDKVIFRSDMKTTSSTKISTIPKGKKLNVISEIGDWLQIYYGGKNGYILKSKTNLAKK